MCSFFFFFGVIIWNVYSITRNTPAILFRIFETKGLLSNLEINYHFLQSSSEFRFSQQHLEFSSKEFIAPCPVSMS